MPQCMVEPVHGHHQADGPLLDQIQQAHAAAGVFLGDVDHQAEVGQDQLRPALFEQPLSSLDRSLEAPVLPSGDPGVELGLRPPHLSPAGLQLLEERHLPLPGEERARRDLSQVERHQVAAGPRSRRR